MTDIQYAKVGGPPDEWMGLKIFDKTTGEEVTKVIEVDAGGGWLLRYKTDDSGDFVIDDNGVDPVVEEIQGSFEIKRP